MSAWARSALLGAISAGFLLGAGYHVIGLMKPAWAEPSPAWRHALFVAINLACAAGFARRPRWFVYPFAGLVAQQLSGHGRYGWTVLREEGRIDWASVVVIVAMPLALWLLVADGRARSAGGVEGSAPAG